MKHYGFDIISEQTGRDVLYHIGTRDFQLPELKLLVDSVQSAKFITEKKSKELIRKLNKLISKYDAHQLDRQVIISGRIKTMNESIYYNVDKIHSAINQDSQIRFQYFQWTVDNEMELRHDGALYQISPWTLAWDNENYYMVGYDPINCIIKHYRVDKMLNISITDLRRIGQDAYEAKNIPTYSQRLFGMFGGAPVRVTIEANNNKAFIFIDRFGKGIHLRKINSTHFSLTIDVEVSDHFLGWIFALGNDVKIVSPEWVVEKMRVKVESLSQLYS